MSHRIFKQTDDTGVVIDAVISGDMEITTEERKSLDSLTTSKPAPLPLPADWLGGPAPREGREDGQYLRRIRDSILPWHEIDPPAEVVDARTVLEELFSARTGAAGGVRRDPGPHRCRGAGDRARRGGRRGDPHADRLGHGQDRGPR